MNQLLYTTKIPIWDGFTTCLSKIIKPNILFKEYNQIINTFKDNNESDILKLFEIDEYNRALIKQFTYWIIQLNYIQYQKWCTWIFILLLILLYNFKS